ncbi:hypothetical protein AB0271_13145, partial [Kocuria palustris]|uniref:hypothetical protein n=1 Tax=Kocuria palustris TaxID=71999 RepID=UPI003450DA15
MNEQPSPMVAGPTISAPLRRSTRSPNRTVRPPLAMILQEGWIRRGLTPDLGHAESSTMLGKRESKDGKEELHRRV